MPESDSLQPPLSKEAREIRSSYGGWTNFMNSYNLKPWDSNDNAEGKAIIEGLAAQELYNQASSAGETSKANDNTGGKGGQ